ncbi:DUF2207 domain-containing protein [Aequorivita sp. F64183]|uniref:DUF2207 domain-containing protein n=1 Tax=Aequorivita xiaoshiensis TaxID=2874476 RepID=A0A9X1U6L6_9FLAO|nr:DUF2207 domain-containing protein [Aequorivita xiaoshiensis]
MICGIFFFLKASSQNFTVDYAKVDIYISEEGYFDVVENYDITFTAPKYGIYRTIQTQYDIKTEEGTNEKRKIEIKKLDVSKHKYSTTPFLARKVSNDFEIKIGNKDKTIIGPEHYEIKYRVYNAFLYEEENTHFYWNIKPDNWLAPFKKLDFTIHIPESIHLDLDNFYVYSGERGETAASPYFEVNYVDGVFLAKSTRDFNSATGESVTALVKLPASSIKEIKPFWPFWSDYGWIIILGALIFVFYLVWNKYGKDDKVIATTSYFPPSGIDPAMAGYLIDDKGDTEDLIALLPYWGERGIIAIKEIPKKNWFGKSDTKITRLRPLPEGAPPYEIELFNGIFGSEHNSGEKSVLISSLKNSFYTKMDKAKRLLKKQAQVYYDPKANKVQIGAIVGLLLINFILLVVFLIFWGFIAVITLVPVFIFLLYMTVHLVKKNAKGTQVLSELKGFKQFIIIAEENKLKMLLKDSPNYFESTMSYALAFGLLSNWVKKFEALDIQPPTWYSSTGGVVTINNFSKSFSDTIQSTKSTMVSSPSSSSSGGGSSGGGFGGGGGGSW